MRRVRYSVAMSLDGYIAGPKGEYDWIIMDPEIDFAAMFAEFDTVLMGRRTFELSASQTSGGEMFGCRLIVFSRTLRQADHPRITIVADNAPATVTEVKKHEGKDIWLFGGGVLFQSLLEAGVVHSVEVGVIPVLLGGGIPLLPPPCKQVKLELATSKALSSGILMLKYNVVQGAA
jgi:dihydrofolate reductase